MLEQLRPVKSIPHDDRPPAADVSFVVDGIRSIFHDIFQIEVAEGDGFFDLGGDSLAGETLIAGIEKDFGISLPLSVLLETSTPRALADAIVAQQKKAQPPSILYTVSDTGSGTPLICIHGSTGTAAFSRKLRDVLPDRPIYAIRALGLLPGEVPLISVQEMARSYVREIREVLPSGPYHIFGQCMTAQVAYEVAQQLSAAGESVKTVTLGDPFRLKRRSKLRRFYYWLTGQRALSIARRLPHLTGTERKQKVLRPARLAAIKTYETLPYSGRMLIVAASNNIDELLHPKRGYPALVPHLETIVVKGKHRDVFTRMDPAAPGKLARAMCSFIARHD